MINPLRATVVQFPRRFRDDDELEQYAIKIKEIRLKGLANDPKSFSSSLVREIDQPMQFWTERLTQPEARHFVVCLPNAEHPGGDIVDPLNSTFLATLVLFGPRTVDLDNFEHTMPWKHFVDGTPRPAQLSLEGSTLMYYICAVYVDSSCRRQGLGCYLSVETIKAIRLDVQETRAAKAICIIGAEQNNVPALKLYEKLGFTHIAEDRETGKDGRIVGGIQLRLDIQ